MSPAAWEIVSDVSTKSGIAIEMIVGRCRSRPLMLARVEVAQRLRARGYSTSQIGRVVNRDHTTVLFYLGNGKKRPSGRRWWRKPRVKHLCWIRTEQPPKLKTMPRCYLVPYAGADMTEYVWRERPKRVA